jgi:hypothetical protein
MELTTMTKNAVRDYFALNGGWEPASEGDFPPKAVVAAIPYDRLNECYSIGKKGMADVVQWLAEDGLAMTSLPRKTCRFRIERLRWWDAQQHLPDHDSTVLVLLRDSRVCALRWAIGYFDLTARIWRDDNMNALCINDVVTYWCEPDGPPGA